jgi:hypothetical protein
MLLGLVLTLPQRIDRTLQSVRGADAACTAQMTRDETKYGRDTARCFELEAGGIWVEKEYQREIGWQDIATVAAPSAPAQLPQGVATDLVQRVCYDGSAVLLTCYTMP